MVGIKNKTQIKKKNIAGISVTIRKNAKQKNLYIRVKQHTGEVVVSVPKYYSSYEIEKFVLKNIEKIQEMQTKALNTTVETRKFITGEKHYFFGKEYELKVIAENTNYKITIVDNTILFSVPNNSTVSSREKYFNEWYRKELYAKLPEITNKYERIMNVSTTEYRIKNMKTRWGTCNINKKRIWLNLQLAKKPIECLECVIVHELVHLLETNHTKRFYELMEKYYPKWEVSEKLLKMNT